MIAGGNRLSPTESTDETGGLRSNSDEVYEALPPLKKHNNAASQLHLTTAFGGASPQGEALKTFYASPTNHNLQISPTEGRFH